MSFVNAAPDRLVAAARNLAGIGSTLSASNATAAVPTLAVSAAASDQVSAAVAAFFSGHAQGYQTLSAQAAKFHTEFVQALSAGANSYASAEPPTPPRCNRCSMARRTPDRPPTARPSRPALKHPPTPAPSRTTSRAAEPRIPEPAPRGNRRALCWPKARVRRPNPVPPAAAAGAAGCCCGPAVSVRRPPAGRPVPPGPARPAVC